ncbi:MAG TPA: serine/threonine-protein kinase, partial [Polyangiaceae bacterium]
MTDRPEAGPLACPDCGNSHDALARFCSHCGLSLVALRIPIDTRAFAAHEISRTSLQRVALDSTRPPSSRAPSAALHDRPTDPGYLADPLIGMVIAERYRILEQIGRGGMGVVYRAEHARIGKLMALKLLAGELTRDREQVARFKREALLASKLSSPNTVQVFDFGTSETLVYLAMEYLRGEDLSRLIRRQGPLGVERTAKIVIQICASLGEAHDKGIVHRDLKPENILIVPGPNGEDLVKVLDFGLAKLRESPELSDVTTRGAIVGTPYYMSPEQIRGESVGPQSDVYSLGALMYACLTASFVFDGNTPMAVLSRHLTDDPVSPSQRFPELAIPEAISQVVMSTLRKDPARRLPSVVALRDSLVSALDEREQQHLAALLELPTLRQGEAHNDELATRDEIEAYERRLRARGRFAWALALAALFGALAIAARVYLRMTAVVAFDGNEHEPNDSASSANPVPFGESVNGQLGKRIDQQRSDRDFFSLDVPSSANTLRIEFAAIPNMASCLLLYPHGDESPRERYCLGSAGLDLSIPALRIPPGKYLLAVMQDRDTYSHDPPPPVFENVSDSYRLSVSKSEGGSDEEIEPNDTPSAGSPVAVGQTVRGRLAWMRDVDVFCVSTGAARIRFEIEDPRPRPRTAVLEVTPLAGPDRDVPVRVHRPGTDVTASARDVVGRYRSDALPVESGAPACVSLSLTPNPWAPTPHPLVAPAGDQEYS